MNWFQSAILGIVQGLTEFLPISSTAHLRIVPALLNWEDPGTEFSAIIQLGTMFSVIIYFWKDLFTLYGSLTKEILESFSKKTFFKLNNPDSKLAFWILIGTIPICVIGLIFKTPLEEEAFRDLNLISFYLIYFGLMLWFSEIVAKQKRSITSIKLIDVILIGLSQAFSLVPGASRSGVTILAGLLLGFKRSDAARFSFLLGVPAILASGLLELYSLISTLKTSEVNLLYSNLFIGLVFAFISGYWAIDFLLKYLQKHKTYIFIIYRIILGIILLIL